MSWSVSAVGRAGAVSKKIAEELGKVLCNEPEESIKRAVGEIVETSLSACDPNQAVRVEASGSQSDFHGVKTNQLKVDIQPIWGFLE